MVSPDDTRIAQARAETDRLEARARAKPHWKGKDHIAVMLITGIALEATLLSPAMRHFVGRGWA